MCIDVDKLQEDVESTLYALRQAGIYIWLLTGDKLETAISVAFSCKLIEPEFHLMFLNRQKDVLLCKKSLISFWLRIKNSTNLEKLSLQENLTELEIKLGVAVKLANFLLNKLINQIDQKQKDDESLNQTQNECLNRLEAKIDELIKLESALRRLKIFSFKKNHKILAKKIKIKKLNKSILSDIEELKAIEYCLNTNDFNVFHQTKQHTYRKNSSSIDLESGCFNFSKEDNQKSENEFKNFNLADELKEVPEVSKYLKEKFALILDGGSLYIALKYHYKLFELVCQHCSVVICTRMSPLQKAQVSNFTN